MTQTPLRNEAVARLIGISPETLKRWRCEGKGPHFRKLGPQKQDSVTYDADVVNAWLEARDLQSTSQHSAAVRTGTFGNGSLHGRPRIATPSQANR